MTSRRPWRERSIGVVSKDISRREDKSPVTLTHLAAMTAVGVVGVIVAFWVLSGIIGFIFTMVKIAVVIGLIGGVFWVVSRFRR